MTVPKRRTASLRYATWRSGSRRVPQCLTPREPGRGRGRARLKLGTRPCARTAALNGPNCDADVSLQVLNNALYGTLVLHGAWALWHTSVTVDFCLFSAETNGNWLRLTAVLFGQVLVFTPSCVWLRDG